MKLPRVSISFYGRADRAKDQSTRAPVRGPHPHDARIRRQTEDIIDHAAAVTMVLESGAVTAEHAAAAHEHVRSIQLAWKEFQTNLDEDRLVLRLARRVELLEQLHALEERHRAALAELGIADRRVETLEAQA